MKNILTWIVKNKLIVAVAVAAFIPVALGFADLRLAIAYAVGVGSALVTSYFAAGEAPWKD